MHSSKNECNHTLVPMQEGVVSWEKVKAKEFGLKSQEFQLFGFLCCTNLQLPLAC